MKKVFLLLGLCFLFSFSSNGQSKIDKATISIKSNIECQACQKLIERYFQKEQGIIRLYISYRKNFIKATYHPSRMTPSMIRTDIANLGFNADTVKANPYYQKRLPPCCRPEKKKSVDSSKTQ